MPGYNANKLKGQFIECCDCYTICPCWIKDRPDEDHCSALYVWTFDDDAQIFDPKAEREDKWIKIGGKSVVAAAFYGSRDGLQAAIYVDHSLEPLSTRKLLLDAFSGKSETITSLQSLGRLIGTVVDSDWAEITRKPREDGGWEITVKVNGSLIAQAKGTEAILDQQSKPLRLFDTGLHDELGIPEDEAVIVQKVDHFEMAVSPLPGGPFVYAGRSGMAAKFDYSKR
jgi:hypothetical protein